jgi:hypothetical protein
MAFAERNQALIDIASITTKKQKISLQQGCVEAVWLRAS